MLYYNINCKLCVRVIAQNIFCRWVSVQCRKVFVSALSGSSIRGEGLPREQASHCTLLHYKAYCSEGHCTEYCTLLCIEPNTTLYWTLPSTGFVPNCKIVPGWMRNSSTKTGRPGWSNLNK